MRLNTTKTVAELLGTSERRVQQLIKEMGIVPLQVVGKSFIISDEDVARLAGRSTRRGRPKKARAA